MPNTIVELKQAGQFATVVRRRDFGDEHRSGDGGGPYAQAADESRDHEGPRFWSDGRRNRRNKIQDPDDDQAFPASQPCRWNTAEDGAEDRSPQGSTHAQAVPESVELPKTLKVFFSARNNDRVKAE